VLGLTRAYVVEFIDLFLTAIGGAGFALAVAAFLGREWLRLQIDKALEGVKGALSQKAEVLKTELSIHAHEQNVGLTRIDAHRSEAILLLWRILSDWEETFLDLTAPNRRLEAELMCLPRQ
jgi:hypothetical protein